MSASKDIVDKHMMDTITIRLGGQEWRVDTAVMASNSGLIARALRGEVQVPVRSPIQAPCRRFAALWPPNKPFTVIFALANTCGMGQGFANNTLCVPVDLDGIAEQTIDLMVDFFQAGGGEHPTCWRAGKATSLGNHRRDC